MDYEYKRITIVSRNELSSWKSCQHIIRNLYQAYSLVFNNSQIQFLKVEAEDNQYKAYKAAKQLKHQSPDLVIWLDHIPNPTQFLHALVNEYEGVDFSLRPRMLVHLFGDFVLDCQDWEKVKADAGQWPLHFIVASERQQRLVERFIPEASQLVSYVPFPVDTSVFNTDDLAKNRQTVREAWQISVDEKIFLYTGRISYQKNIDVLLRAFDALVKKTGGKNTLWIAGAVDDILLPYFGKHGITGSYSTHLNQTLKEITAPVKFLGSLPPEELVQVYQAADLFISLSTYNDEDYGMAPAEALCCGLPAVLSDWGGYTSFANYSSSVQLVPVKMSAPRPMVETSSLQKTLILQALEPQLSEEKRLLVSREACEKLSIPAIASELKRLINQISFGRISYSDRFHQMCGAFRRNKFAPFINSADEARMSQLYKEIYSAYCD